METPGKQVNELYGQAAEPLLLAMRAGVQLQEASVNWLNQAINIAQSSTEALCRSNAKILEAWTTAAEKAGKNGAHKVAEMAEKTAEAATHH
jgi:hypothetical protein